MASLPSKTIATSFINSAGRIGRVPSAGSDGTIRIWRSAGRCLRLCCPSATRNCPCWRKWQVEVKRRALLTGARGFVGRQVRGHLADSFELHCTSREPVADASAVWHRVDLRDPQSCADLIERIRPDILVHTAWNTQHGEFWEAEDNAEWLEAGRSLFTAFSNAGGQRIVACGSCAEYPVGIVQPCREDEVIDPSEVGSGYGRAKLALLEHLRGLVVEFAWARIFFVYGPHEDE